MGFMNYSHSMLTPWMKGWTTMGDFELIGPRIYSKLSAVGSGNERSRERPQPTPLSLRCRAEACHVNASVTGTWRGVMQRQGLLQCTS